MTARNVQKTRTKITQPCEINNNIHCFTAKYQKHMKYYSIRQVQKNSTSGLGLPLCKELPETLKNHRDLFRSSNKHEHSEQNYVWS